MTRRWPDQPGDTEVLDLFRNLKVWKKGDQRAPHKPLLVLMALARLQGGGERLWSFEDINPLLHELLVEFGPGDRKSVHPEYPFWYLRNDGVWEVPDAATLARRVAHRKRSKDIPKGVLLEMKAQAGFPPELDALLRTRPDLVNRIAALLLDAHFPRSVHEDILDAVAFPWVVEPRFRRARDPAFRERILRIYERRCAVCGYDGRMGRAELGLEAAHIKWHCHSGPDTEDNGLALCLFHHRALDRGALGIDQDHTLMVSQHAIGSVGLPDWLHRYAGRPLRTPVPGGARPHEDHISWHQREVFKSPARLATSP